MLSHLLFISFSIPHVHDPWQNQHSSLQVKSWTSSMVVSYDLGIHLSPHLRALHNSMPYIRHYIPQNLVSCKRIKLRENPFQKPLKIEV